MKWFKHQSDMRYDSKIRRLISKHGVAGYGVYNFVLEAIVMSLDTDSPIPELEDTSQDIAEYLRMDTVKVEEIILFCLHQGLFEQSETTGSILCKRVYKYIDKASTRSEELRKMITSYNDRLQVNTNALSGIVRDKPRQSRVVADKADRIEENRIEEKRENQSPRNPKISAFKAPDLYEVVQYCDERGNDVDGKKFVDFYEAKGWMIGKNKMKDWKAAVRTWEKSPIKQKACEDDMRILP